MRIFGMLVMIGVLCMPLVASAEEAAQQPSQERIRSPGRTWTGVALLGLGAYVSVDAAMSVCGTNALGSAIAGQSCGQARTKFVFGLGMVGTGVLLATVFSDVPVVRDMTVAPTRGGVQVGASFGF